MTRQLTRKKMTEEQAIQAIVHVHDQINNEKEVLYTEIYPNVGLPMSEVSRADRYILLTSGCHTFEEWKEVVEKRIDDLYWKISHDLRRFLPDNKGGVADDNGAHEPAP